MEIVTHAGIRSNCRTKKKGTFLFPRKFLQVMFIGRLSAPFKVRPSEISCGVCEVEIIYKSISKRRRTLTYNYTISKRLGEVTHKKGGR